MVLIFHHNGTTKDKHKDTKKYLTRGKIYNNISPSMFFPPEKN